MLRVALSRSAILASLPLSLSLLQSTSCEEEIKCYDIYKKLKNNNVKLNEVPLKNSSSNFVILSGSNSQTLTRKICQELGLNSQINNIFVDNHNPNNIVNSQNNHTSKYLPDNLSYLKKSLPSYNKVYQINNEKSNNGEDRIDSASLSGPIAENKGKKVEEKDPSQCTVCSNIDVKLFSDGELSLNLHQSIRGKDVIIVQTCSPPVNNSILELVLSITAARRNGAASITAIVPYFAYRLNRRGLPISTLHKNTLNSPESDKESNSDKMEYSHQTRFLWNAHAEIVKLLLTAGVDKIVSVEIQRIGQGHEAFPGHHRIPVETVRALDIFLDHLPKEILNEYDSNKNKPHSTPLGPTASLNSQIKNNEIVRPVLIAAGNVELFKKSKKLQKKLKQIFENHDNKTVANISIDCGAFLRVDSDEDTHYMKGNSLQFQGDVKDKTVILIEDYIGMFLKNFFSYVFI